jgi:hypothetical protein
MSVHETYKTNPQFKRYAILVSFWFNKYLVQQSTRIKQKERQIQKTHP